jgi:hypothetical protein
MANTNDAFESLVREYLEDLQNTYRTAISSGEATPELSYRPALHRFLEKLPVAIGVRNVDIIFEPRRQALAGRPDWRFHHTRSMGIFGYAEAKAFEPSQTIEPSQFQTQTDMYLGLGHRLILTDGIDFVFFDLNRRAQHTCSLVEKPLSSRYSWRDLRINTDILIDFANFFQRPVPRTLSDSKLITSMALRAKKISEDVSQLIDLEEGSGFDEEENRNIEALHGLKDLLTTGHDPDLCDNRKFADMVSQVVVFGLLYAHRHLASTVRNPRELSQRLHSFWIESVRSDGANRLRPFRALAESLSTETRELGLLRTWYTDCVSFLSHVRLRDTRNGSMNYHALYEQFLSSYDPKSRVDFGAYATPDPLVRYIVAFCDWIAQNRLGHSSLYVSGNKIIDPCCGTGSFLEDFLRALPVSVRNEARFPTMAGFEILPAPYALAQYRLALLSSSTISGADHVRVVMCNTLADSMVDSVIPQAPTTGPSTARHLFQEEREEAVGLATPPIMAIIGNPPSSDAGRHIDPATHGRILELVDDFRPPEVKRTSRQNVQKQMQNDFVKFVRWACHKLPEREPGIMAFVLPSSFLKHRAE